MKLHSRVEPVYLPEPDQASVLRLGLQTLAEADWILADADLPKFHEHKLKQLQGHADLVSLSLPGSADAQQELGRALLHNLITHHAAGYQLEDSHLSYSDGLLRWPLHALDLRHSALWVQEDICLLEAKDEEYILTAASVCSPSNWRLEKKIGRSIDVIHGPVPGYRKSISERVNRLLASLKPGKAVQRFNWSVQAGNELFWREDLELEDSASASYAPELHWRVERQTLVRLPQTGAIVFGIRIFLHSFTRMKQFPAFEAALKNIIARLPQDQKKYKGLS